HFEVRQPRGGELAELLLLRTASLAQDDRGRDLFSKVRIGERKSERLRDRRVVHEDFIQLARGDLLAAAVDDLLEPPCEEEIALRIQVALVAGPEPGSRERRAVSLRVILVTTRHGGA